MDALLAGLLAALDEIGTAERTSSILSAVAATVPAATAEVPAPSASAGAVSSANSPVTPVENAIAAAWCDVLGIAEVDVTANFFDLGGDSFSAVRAVSRIEGATVALLALNPTVRDLAIAIDSLEPEDRELDADLERQLAEKQAPKEHPVRPGQLEPGLLVSRPARGASRSSNSSTAAHTVDGQSGVPVVDLLVHAATDEQTGDMGAAL